MAYDFDGTGDYFDFGDLSVFDELSTMTVAAFVQMDTLTADGGILTHRGTAGDNDGFIFLFDDVAGLSARTDTFTLYVEEDAANARIEGATSAATTGSWQHVGATFLGNDSNGLRLYVGGAEDANSPASSVGVSTTSTSTLNPGVQVGDAADGTRDIDGKLAEVAAWNRVLSGAEMASLASGFSPLFFPGLIFYAPLVREDEDIVGGNAPSVNGTPSVFPHPRMIYPHTPHAFAVPAVPGTIAKFGGRHRMFG